MRDANRIILDERRLIVFLRFPVQKIIQGWLFHAKISNIEYRMLNFKVQSILNLLLFYTSSYGHLQIFHKVFCIFDAHAQANERIAQSVLNAFFAGNRRMRHGSGVIDQ